MPRLGRIMAAFDAADGSRRSSARLCEVATALLGVTGAGVMLMSGDIPQVSPATNMGPPFRHEHGTTSSPIRAGQP